MRENKKELLVIEDDVYQAYYYRVTGNSAGYNSYEVNDYESAMKLIKEKEFDVILVDVHLSVGSQSSFEGLDILKFVKKYLPSTISLAMSSDPKVDTFHKTQEAGAWGFLKKPILNVDELKIAIEQAVNRKQLMDAVKKQKKKSCLPNNLLKVCPDGRCFPSKLRETTKKVSINGNIPVVITGETGTGKEEVAQLIHRNRCELEKRHIPFVAVNCASLSNNMALSQLFGHVRGAFTGADKLKKGYIEEAHDGILFLDEIHTLNFEVQQQLLRVLNNGYFERLGDNKTIYSSFQIIVASTKNLDEEVGKERFLLDLRSRICGMDINLPPLRERFEDLPIFIALFFAQKNVSIEEHNIERLTNQCKKYYWQGNIRLLFKVLDTMLMEAMLDEIPLNEVNIPEYQLMLPPKENKNNFKNNMIASDNSCFLDNSNKVNLNNKNVLEKLIPILGDKRSLPEKVSNFEKIIIENALERFRSSKKTMEYLQIPKSSFLRKRKQYNL